MTLVINLEEAIESITSRTKENDPSYSSFLLKGASAFEIVRCKDCRRFQGADCPAMIATFERMMCGNDYCSKGELR